jgi:putative FmdB family regulatory protein
MPTYDYKCNACGHAFEHFQSMSDKPLRKCPKCGKTALQRLIGTGAAVMFKGSGFYQTDYRSESYKKSAEADKPAAASAGASDSGKAGETKADKSKAGESKSAESKAPETKTAEPKASSSAERGSRAVEKKPARHRKPRAKDD